MVRSSNTGSVGTRVRLLPNLLLVPSCLLFVSVTYYFHDLAQCQQVLKIACYVTLLAARICLALIMYKHAATRTIISANVQLLIVIIFLVLVLIVRPWSFSANPRFLVSVCACPCPKAEGVSSDINLVYLRGHDRHHLKSCLLVIVIIIVFCAPCLLVLWAGADGCVHRPLRSLLYPASVRLYAWRGRCCE